MSQVFSLFQVSKMCLETIQQCLLSQNVWIGWFYNSKWEKYNSLSWVSFLPFRGGNLEFIPAKIRYFHCSESEIWVNWTDSDSEFYMLKHYSGHITLSMAIISMWTHNTIGRACSHSYYTFLGNTPLEKSDIMSNNPHFIIFHHIPLHFSYVLVYLKHILSEF